MKGFHRAGTFSSNKVAQKRARSLRGKFHHVRVKKGTAGTAWGNPRTVYRVWVR